MRYSGASSDLKNRTRIKYPDLNFSDSLILDHGDITFEMFYFGTFHSGSDIIIYVPGVGMLFTGDLFSEYGRPGSSDNLKPDTARNKKAAGWIERRSDKITTIISGHGEILSRDDLNDFLVRFR